MDYTKMSIIFAKQGITIENFIVINKIERVKNYLFMMTFPLKKLLLNEYSGSSSIKSV
jgi:ABC-type microcin C transport system permease subunit YejB